MLFNTIDYWIFFLVVLVGFYSLPFRAGKLFLLGVSYFFYMWWNPRLIILILTSTVIDYFLGILLETCHAKRRKPLLVASLVVNLGILGFFKYYNFFAASLANLLFLPPDSLALSIILPVGISFYTFASLSYTIDIYRLGDYGGMGARKVDTIQHTGVQSQPTPLRDSTTGLVDAGNWSVSASWAVPADAVSGVYIAKLVRQDGTAGENQIPFIVRDDSSHSDVIFQTSDETWQAYNPWGGANLYGGNGPAGDSSPGRAYAVSYNRPITTRGGVGPTPARRTTCSAPNMHRSRGWSRTAMTVLHGGVDVDRFGSLLLNHKVYMDTGHDEYWSGQQRTNVEAARDAGVNLQFWSGNEVYWRTRWGNALSSDATPYRTLISYKETWANSSIDPTNQWTDLS
jgi:hypothetical protein